VWNETEIYYNKLVTSSVLHPATACSGWITKEEITAERHAQECKMHIMQLAVL
jgi:hypothetical protein